MIANMQSIRSFTFSPFLITFETLGSLCLISSPIRIGMIRKAKLLKILRNGILTLPTTSSAGIVCPRVYTQNGRKPGNKKVSGGNGFKVELVCGLF